MHFIRRDSRRGNHTVGVLLGKILWRPEFFQFSRDGFGSHVALYFDNQMLMPVTCGEALAHSNHKEISHGIAQ
jgi:hypothetical protein